MAVLEVSAKVNSNTGKEESSSSRVCPDDNPFIRLELLLRNRAKEPLKHKGLLFGLECDHPKAH